jgi:tetratricopeptide (TPR) repeat protein
MTTKPPADRRKFGGAWDEINYLRDKVLYWLYARGEPIRARPYARRMIRLLTRADPDQEAILGQECRSLAYEALGDLRKAIEHRENEVRLIRRGHQISRGQPHEVFVMRHGGFDALSDRLDLLAVLYHDAGDLDRAIRTLRESRELCEEHGIKFDGADLLRDYLAEWRETRPDHGRNGSVGTTGARAAASSGR